MGMVLTTEELLDLYGTVGNEINKHANNLINKGANTLYAKAIEGARKVGRFISGYDSTAEIAKKQDEVIRKYQYIKRLEAIEAEERTIKNLAGDNSGIVLE